MILKGIHVTDDLQEIFEKANEAFPLTLHYSDLGEWAIPAIEWHWHRELEFVFMLRGRIEVSTSGHRYTLSEGEGYFLNRSVLHSIRGISARAPILLAQLLDASLLGGGYQSVYEQKYIDPIVECRELEILPFLLHDSNHRKILEHIRRSYEAADEGAEGYEILVRNELSSAWLLMMQEAGAYMQSRRAGVNPAQERVKRMMLYIQENYAERISLEQIADAANISARECLRDFQTCLQTTPFGYLTDYRLRAAMDRLAGSGASVTEIAGDCGFSSGSYLTRQFRKKTGMTPLAYRKKAAQAAKERPGR